MRISPTYFLSISLTSQLLLHAFYLLTMSSSTFFASVTDTGIAVPDNSTLVFHHFGGQITLQFQSAEHMKTVADKIIKSLSLSIAEAPVADGGDELIDFEALALDGVTSDGEGASSADSQASSTPSEEPNSPLEEPDSSFESYAGHGMTQDAIY